MKKQMQQGFTLIELMIVVAIIGILASIALPAYQDFTIKGRVTEGLGLMSPAKLAIATEVSSTNDLIDTAKNWAANPVTSKYVNSVTMDGASGVLIVTYNNTSVGIKTGEDTLTFSPNVRTSGGIKTLEIALAAGESGSIDWACSSSTHNVADTRVIAVHTAGTLLAKYAPAECR